MKESVPQGTDSVLFLSFAKGKYFTCKAHFTRLAEFHPFKEWISLRVISVDNTLFVVIFCVILRKNGKNGVKPRLSPKKR